MQSAAAEMLDVINGREPPPQRREIQQKGKPWQIFSQRKPIKPDLCYVIYAENDEKFDVTQRPTMTIARYVKQDYSDDKREYWIEVYTQKKIKDVTHWQHLDIPDFPMTKHLKEMGYVDCSFLGVDF